MSTPSERPSHAADSAAVNLAEAGSTLMEEAHSAHNGHASRLLVGGERQRAVLMALTAGSSLSEHESPPAATFQVVAGRARLYAVEGDDWLVAAGDLVAIPGSRHGVVAVEDSVILLTVALG